MRAARSVVASLFGVVCALACTENGLLAPEGLLAASEGSAPAAPAPPEPRPAPEAKREATGQALNAQGVVRAVIGTTLIIETRASENIRVETDGNTLIQRKGKTIAVADIHPGDEVSTLGTRTQANGPLAQTIDVQPRGRR